MSKVAAKQHLKEFRNRLFIVAIFFIVGACLAYYFQQPVIDAVLAPLHGQKLVYLNPAGGFSFIFMISIYAGLALAMPVLIQQLYLFIRPALPERAQKKSGPIIIGGFLLLVAGIAFGYFVAVPGALSFLYSFADQYISASLTADSYLNFVIAYTIGIGIVFQIPLLLLLINTIKPFTPGGLMQSEKWVIVASFVVAAIITPTPDPINQAIIAGPVIIVYQIGVIIILNAIFKKRREEKRLAKKALIAARKQQKAATQRKPITHSKPVAHKNPTPVPAPRPVTRPVFQPAVAKIVTPQKPQLQPHQRIQPAPKPQPQPMSMHLQPAKPAVVNAIDGFARPTHHKIVVPKRPEPQRQEVARSVPRPVSPNQRNFTIDGMYRPLMPQITTVQ
jgi:sec-independent protein translocase protein TatC